MHAQYDDDEKMMDMYSVHRICQAYQLSKFVNLVAENSGHSRSGSDVILLAGDLNTSPGQLPFNLLLSMTGLIDSHEGESTDHVTCGHHLNTYSVTDLNQTGKRIDFILFKLAQNCQCQVLEMCQCDIKHSCSGSRIECMGKNPVTGLSFSDHQPVSIKLVIKKRKDNLLQKEINITNGNKNYDQDHLKHLEATYRLLVDYLSHRSTSRKRFYLFLIGMVVILSGLTILVSFKQVLDMSYGTLFHVMLLLLTGMLVVMVLKEFAWRFERTAINGILEEILVLLSKPRDQCCYHSNGIEQQVDQTKKG